jgi:uncharacterized protein
MVNRELYMDKIRPLIDKDIIKVITGIRRCGKSYFLNLIIEELKNKGIKDENIILINFESIEYNSLKTKEELDELVLNLTKNISGRFYLLFDEIQNVEKWEKAITGYRVSFDCDIYITGSNSKLLSGELATFLAGRYMEIKLHPFSFNEFLSYKSGNDERESFQEYFKYGGMPFTLALDNQQKIDYLNDIYNSIVLKEVVEKYKLRDVNLLHRLILYLFDNIGNPFSVTNISKYLKHFDVGFSNNTIYNYLQYLEDALIISKLPREDIQGKKFFKLSEKYYVTDHGFITVLLGEKQQNIGGILENIVYMEFLRHGYEVSVGKIKNYEVDFICRKNKRKVYVQVCFQLASEEIEDREFRPLKLIDDNFEKFVISMDDFDFSREGIKHLNMIKFLKEFI